MQTSTNGKYPYLDATDQVADYPTTSQTLAQLLDPIPNRNAIINPTFDIAQRGTGFSITGATAATYTADRWAVSRDGTTGGVSAVVTANPNGTTIGGVQATRYMSVVVTGPGGTYNRLLQRIESVNTFAGEQITVSAYVRNNGAGNFTTATVRAVQFFGSGAGASSPVTTSLGTIAIGTSWTRVSVTGTLPALTGKTTNGSDNYLEIHFDLGAIAGTFQVWGVQVEKRPSASALERRPIGHELQLCQRYYYRVYGEQVYSTFGFGYMDTSTNVLFPLYLPVPLRALPSSANVSAPSDFQAQGPSGTSGCVSFGFRGGGTGTANTRQIVGVGFGTAAAFSVGVPVGVLANNRTTAWIEISAEL